VPKKVSSTFELTINGFSTEGEGIGHYQGRAVFVPFTVPGERILARPSRTQPRRTQFTNPSGRKFTAEAIELLTPSKDRIVPACPVFGPCGGCQLMHIRYGAQQAIKAQVLCDVLRSIARLNLDRLPAITEAFQPLHYRNHGQYKVGEEGRQVVTGFFAAHSHHLVPVNECRLHDPRINQAVTTVTDWANHKHLPVYNEQHRTGWLRHVSVRTSAASSESLVTLVAGSDRSGNCGELVKQLRKTVPGVAGLLLNINSRVTPIILGDRYRLLWGRDWIEERLLGVRFRLSAGSFFQINSKQARTLFEKVHTLIGHPGGPIVDAYCGVGVLALTLAARGHEVVGIEINRQAIADARQNAAQNHLSSTTFYHGAVEETLPRLMRRGLRPAAVVLDPPRKGCDPRVIEALIKSKTRTIAYISCHPGTLARDLGILLKHGYRLTSIEGVDMFPQTCHLEVLAGLTCDGSR
jgi:23S rRNA (uracil1939-C5)-methyltransferase